MKLLTLLIILISFNVQARSVCTYVFGCAECVIEVESDPPLTIKTQDLACKERLKNLNSFPYNIPRNKTEVDKTPLPSQYSERTQFAFSVLSNSIDKIYQYHNEQQELSKFYRALPDILRDRHNDLMQIMVEQDQNRESDKINKSKAIKQQTENLIKEMIAHRKTIKSPEISPSKVLDTLGINEEIREIDRELKQNGIHDGFPNLTGTNTSGHGRERSRNKDLHPERRDFHAQILNHADNFRKNHADDLADELAREAKDFRRGSQTPLPLTDRVAAFELNQSYVEDQRHQLQERISQEVQPQIRSRLESIDSFSGELAQTGRNEFYSGDLDEGEHWTNAARQILDIGLGFVPVISVGKDLLEAISGENYLTRQKLEPWERGFAMISASTLGVGTLAKNTFGIAQKLSRVLTKAGKLHVDDVLDPSLLKQEARLFNKFGNRTWVRGDNLNEAYRIEKEIPVEKYIEPWVSQRRVLEFTSKEDIIMYRVFSDPTVTAEQLSSMNGRWFSRINPVDLAGDKLKLKSILNLPEENLMQSYIAIKVPAGTRMRMGVVGHGKDGMKGGGIQYDLLNEEFNPSWMFQSEGL